MALGSVRPVKTVSRNTLMHVETSMNVKFQLMSAQLTRHVSTRKVPMDANVFLATKKRFNLVLCQLQYRIKLGN